MTRQLIVNGTGRDELSRLFQQVEARLNAVEGRSGSSSTGTKIIETTNTVVNEINNTTVKTEPAPFWRQFMMGGY